jgi:hypothetical protein
MLQSCYLRNEGNGKFTFIPLPVAQISAINGMVVDDFDGDGNLMSRSMETTIPLRLASDSMMHYTGCC